MNVAVQSRKERRQAELTKLRIASFQEHFSAYGNAHLFLAFHAAFPLILTPDLVYHIWVHFDRDEYNRLLDIPWIATADLLLSELCREVGYELYEMIPEVRKALLEQFNVHERFAGRENDGQTPRLDELADFLQRYSEHLRRDFNDANSQAMADVHLWTALSHSNPELAAQQMLGRLNQGLAEDDKAEILRMADLTAELAERQAKYRPLLLYLEGVEEFAMGNDQLASARLDQVELSKIEPLGIRLVMPEIRLEEEVEEAGEETTAGELPGDALNYQVRIAHLVQDNFTVDQLRALCLNLGLVYEMLPGESMAVAARALVQQLARQGRLDELQKAVLEMMPNLQWPQSFGEMPDREALRIAYVTAENGLNMRSGPGTTTEVLQRLNKGTAVEVLEEGEWARVRLADQVGFVASQFLASEPPAEIPSVDQFQNPYLGPRPFTFDDAQFFFGREKEIEQLVSDVERQQLVLVYGPAGAGKSSLVSAGLVPRLKQDGFQVLPIGSISGPELTTSEPRNVFMSSLLLSIEPSATPYAFERTSLNEYLSYGVAGSELKIDQEARGLVLVIDRIEEIVLSTVEVGPHREEFFAQVAEAIEANPRLRVVLIVQEEYRDALERYWGESPAFRSMSRIRVDLLSPDTARGAISRAAALSGRHFEPEAAAALVDRLLEIKGPDGVVAGSHVDPLTLQLFCYQLWQNLASDQRVITLADVQALGQANQALANYYERAIRETAAAQDISESSLRDWFEYELITPERTRSVVFRDPAESQGLPNAAVDQLTSMNIVHQRIRSGSIWLELAQDRWVEPILQANEAWRQRTASGEEETIEVRVQDQVRVEAGRTIPESLQRNVGQGRCLPVLSEVFLSGDTLIDPTSGRHLLDERLLAEFLAEEATYPFAERDNLPQVAQYLKVEADEPGEFAAYYPELIKVHLLNAAGQDTTVSRSLIEDLFQKSEDLTVTEMIRRLGWLDNALREGGPLRLIAGWPLDIFVTTSYHTILESALEAAGKKPQSDYCRLSAASDPAGPAGYRNAPTRFSEGEPLVYHLFGLDLVPESLVLSEDDFLEWLMAVSADDELLPEPLRRALSGADVLFLDCPPNSLAFKVLVQALLAGQQASSHYRRIVTTGDDAPQAKAGPAPERDPAYVNAYLSQAGFDVYPSSGRDLVAAVQDALLRERGDRNVS